MARPQRGRRHPLSQQVGASPEKVTANGFSERVLGGTRVELLQWSPDSPSRSNKALRTAIALALQGDRTLDSILPNGITGHESTFPQGGKVKPKVTWKNRINLTLAYDETAPNARDLADTVRNRLEDTGGLSVRLAPGRSDADLVLVDRKAWTATPLAWLQAYVDDPLPAAANAVEATRNSYVATTDDTTSARLLGTLQRQRRATSCCCRSASPTRPSGCARVRTSTAARTGPAGSSASSGSRRERRRGTTGPVTDAATSEQAPVPSGVRIGPLRAGERITLTDPKGRRHSVLLAEGGTFTRPRAASATTRSSAGPRASSSPRVGGTAFLALRPLLNEFTVTMPRGAAVIYPKDAAQILMACDVFPGARVVEAGAGSGALTCSLLRAVGPTGSVRSYERRDDFAAQARRNVESFFGSAPGAWDLTVGDLVEQLEAEPEPRPVDRVSSTCWRRGSAWTPSPSGSCPAGSCSRTWPRRPSWARTVETLRVHGGFTEPEATETLLRAWHAEGWPCARATTWSGTPASWSARGGWRPASRPRPQASAGPGGLWRGLHGAPRRGTRRGFPPAGSLAARRWRHVRFQLRLWLGGSSYEDRESLLVQIGALREELARLRERVSAHPHDLAVLERRLTDARAEARTTTANNERLAATLREARDQIVTLKGEVDGWRSHRRASGCSSPPRRTVRPTSSPRAARCA